MIMNFSRQREIIRKALLKVQHPTAEEIYKVVRTDIPNISLGTVYRNLAQMVERGELIALPVGERQRFEANPHPHAHFYCLGCGKLEDVPLAESVMDLPKGYVLLNSQCIHRGLCEECAKKEHVALKED